MTERALPAVGIGVRTLPGRAAPRPGAIDRPDAVTRPARPAVARPAVARKEAVLTTPARAGMLIGLSAAAYAVTLAGVAALQSQGDAEIATRRAPYVEAALQARTANDGLEAALLRVGAQARMLASDYAAAGEDVTAYEARLDKLAVLVAEVQGSAAALPARIKLPSVTVHGAVGGGSSSRSAPKTKSTTRASGA